jgi:hypothetical protein
MWRYSPSPTFIVSLAFLRAVIHYKVRIVEKKAHISRVGVVCTSDLVE